MVRWGGTWTSLSPPDMDTSVTFSATPLSILYHTCRRRPTCISSHSSATHGDHTHNLCNGVVEMLQGRVKGDDWSG